MSPARPDTDRRRQMGDLCSSATLEVNDHLRALPTQTTVTLPKDLVEVVLAERHAGWSHARDLEVEVDRLRAEVDRARSRADDRERSDGDSEPPWAHPRRTEGGI